LRRVHLGRGQAVRKSSVLEPRDPRERGGAVRAEEASAVVLGVDKRHLKSMAMVEELG
jgi:hypothetical protein